MSLVICTTALTQGSYQVHVGDVLDSSDVRYIKWPSYFTAAVAVSGTLTLSGANVTASALGTLDPHVVGRFWNNGGTLMVSGG